MKMEDLRPTLDATTRIMRILGDAFQKAVEAVGDSWWNVNKAWYLTEHKRLPGSNRTARLRKKQRDAVYRWVYSQLSHESE